MFSLTRTLLAAKARVTPYNRFVSKYFAAYKGPSIVAREKMKLAAKAWRKHKK